MTQAFTAPYGLNKMAKGIPASLRACKCISEVKKSNVGRKTTLRAFGDIVRCMWRRANKADAGERDSADKGQTGQLRVGHV